MRREANIGGALLFVLAGPLIWAAHLFIVYGAHAMLCTRLPPGHPAIFWLLGSVTLAALALLGALFARPDMLRGLLMKPSAGPQPEFLQRITRFLAGLSLAGVGWASVAILLLSTCAQLR